MGLKMNINTNKLKKHKCKNHPKGGFFYLTI